MAVYAVDKVSQEVSFINGAGDVKKAHLFEWVNYPLSDATWQTHGHGNLSIMKQDILPLRKRLKTEGETELVEHHKATLQLVHYQMKRVLRLAQGENLTDFHVSSFVRLEPTAALL